MVSPELQIKKVYDIQTIEPNTLYFRKVDNVVVPYLSDNTGTRLLPSREDLINSKSIKSNSVVKIRIGAYSIHNTYTDATATLGKVYIENEYLIYRAPSLPDYSSVSDTITYKVNGHIVSTTVNVGLMLNFKIYAPTSNELVDDSFDIIFDALQDDLPAAYSFSSYSITITEAATSLQVYSKIIKEKITKFSIDPSKVILKPDTDYIIYVYYNINTSINNSYQTTAAVNIRTKTSFSVKGPYAYLPNPKNYQGMSFGRELSLSKDGQTLAVSATSEMYDGVTMGVGTVYIYTKNNLSGDWFLRQAILPLKQTNANNGRFVLLSENAEYLFITSNDEIHNTNKLYMYSNKINPDGSYSLLSTADVDSYGPLAYGENDKILYLSYPTGDVSGLATGKIYLYQVSDTGLSFNKFIEPPSLEAGMNFGTSISVNSSNTKMIVGAPNKLSTFGVNTIAGAIYLYNISGTTVTFDKDIILPDTAIIDNKFGSQVLISEDGLTIVVKTLGLSNKDGSYNPGFYKSKFMIFEYNSSTSNWDNTFTYFNDFQYSSTQSVCASAAFANNGKTLFVSDMCYNVNQIYGNAVMVLQKYSTGWKVTNRITTSFNETGYTSSSYGNAIDKLACNKYGSELMAGFYRSNYNIGQVEIYR